MHLELSVRCPPRDANGKGEAFDCGMTNEIEIIVERWLAVPRLYDARDRERKRGGGEGGERGRERERENG
jgi:hypothetical protein